MNTHEPHSTDRDIPELCFADYFQAPGVRGLSVVLGLIAGSVLAFFLSWQIGVLAGALITVVLSIAFPVAFYRADKPYRKIKETLKRPFLVDERVRFTVHGGRSLGGFFVLTEKAMVFLSLEKGEHRLELSRKDVKSVILAQEQFSLRIFINNTQFIEVTSGVCGEIYDVLRENHWI